MIYEFLLVLIYQPIEFIPRNYHLRLIKGIFDFSAAWRGVRSTESRLVIWWVDWCVQPATESCASYIRVHEPACRSDILRTAACWLTVSDRTSVIGYQRRRRRSIWRWTAQRRPCVQSRRTTPTRTSIQLSTFFFVILSAPPGARPPGAAGRRGTCTRYLRRDALELRNDSNTNTRWYVCVRSKADRRASLIQRTELKRKIRIIKNNKLAPCGTDGRLFAIDVSAKFEVTWHKN